MLKYISNLLVFNQATLSGCTDIVVIEQEDGSLVTSPFHVRFGKLKLLKTSEKQVTITVNGVESDMKMKVGRSGEAYFLQPISKEAGEESKDDEEDLEKSQNKVQEVKDEEAGSINQEDLYEGVEFFGEENELKQVHSEEEEKHGYSSDSDSNEIIRSQSEEKYNQIIHKLSQDPGQKRQDSPEGRSKELSPGKSTRSGSRFGWLWGREGENGPRNRRLVVSERKRSKTISQGEEEDIPIPKRWPAHANAKSEVGFEDYKLDELDLPKETNKSQNPLDDKAEQTSPRRGIFGRFIGLFRGRRNQENKDGQALFKLEKVGPKAADPGETSPKDSKQEKGEVGLSLCKNLLFTCDDDEVDEIFEKYQVSYDDFCERYEEIIEDTNLMVRVRDQLYDWRTGAAIVMSELMFGKGLNTQPTDFQQKMDSYAQGPTKDNSAEEAKNTNDEVPNENANVEKIKDFSDDGFRGLAKMKKRKGRYRGALSENPKDKIYLKNLDHDHHEHPADNSDCDIDDEEADTPAVKDIKDIEIPLDRCYTNMEDFKTDEKRKREPRKKYKKYIQTLFLSSDQLKKLNLKYGKNDITFSVDSGFQGTQSNSSRLFFWNHKVKIVISDVDGTITKSDVLGHILPRLGKDWSHEGINKLYTNIRKNGYEFLYLTSRAIGMADSTRTYLQSLEQDGVFKLPDGPCIMSPDRLMHSFKREVIDRKPQLFKISALLNIKNLFKEQESPFYAGFGNRDTDAISYRAVGIDFRRIFIINPQGEVVILKSMYKKSYPLINELVDQMFPPVCSARGKVENEENEESSQFYDLNYFHPETYNEEDLEKELEEAKE